MWGDYSTSSRSVTKIGEHCLCDGTCDIYDPAAGGRYLRLRWDLHLSLSCNPQAEKSHNPQELPHSRRPALHPAFSSQHQAPGSSF